MPRSDGGKFRVLAIGGFGGAGPASPAVRRTRRPVKVDPDTYAAALRGFSAVARAKAGGTEADVRVEALESFAPDRLLAAFPREARVLAARRRLDASETSRAAAEELDSLLGGVVPSTTSAAPPPVPAEGAGLLDSILGASPTTRTEDEVDRLVRQTAEPGLRALRDPTGKSRREDLRAAADAFLSESARQVLACPAVRALEAAWRGLDLFVRTVEPGAVCDLRVLDLARADVDEDVGVSGPFDGSLLHKVIAEETDPLAGGKRWDMVVADLAFDATPRDVATLLRLAKIAGHGETVLVAGAAPGIVGCPPGPVALDVDDWTDRGVAGGRELWAAFRRLPEAQRTALVWPRVLLRAPWGREHLRCESFECEEAPGGPDPARLLWGNGAWAVAAILARAFEAGEGDVRGSLVPEIRGLPAIVVRDEHDEQALVPCAEVRLSSRGVERIAREGVLPLLSAGDDSAVRIVSLDSASDPPRPLAASWL